MGMDENSFDPRSWGKSKAAAEGPASDPEKLPAGQNSIPEAWRDIGRSAESQSPSQVQQSMAPTGVAVAKRFALPALSAVIMLAAAGTAWITREPPRVQDQAATENALPPGTNVVTRSLNLATISDLEASLVASGVAPKDAQAAAQAAAKVLTQQGEVRAVIDLIPGTAGALVLQRLQASYRDGSGTIIDRQGDGSYAGTIVAAMLTKQIKVLRGEIDSTSFYSSAVAAGVIDTLIPEFINAFSYDFNIASEITRGDTFEVSYEQNVNANGEPVGQPELLYASLTTPTKSLALYRFKGADGKVAWYDGNGAITQRGFIRTPVDGARITSNFGMRFHPVLHYNRLHAGVDFGVPIGTPVYAAAAGVVTGATPTGCGGNMAVVTHDNGWVTRYFHLSKYAEGMHEGQRVEQGFTLGLSGTTGSCTTGPHLHYEVRINGEPVDPLSIKTDDSVRKTLSGTEHAAFIKQRNRVDVARAEQAR